MWSFARTHRCPPYATIQYKALVPLTQEGRPLQITHPQKPQTNPTGWLEGVEALLQENLQEEQNVGYVGCSSIVQRCLDLL